MVYTSDVWLMKGICTVLSFVKILTLFEIKRGGENVRKSIIDIDVACWDR